ncbi:MAG: hypothetical protein FD134_2435 [Gallionellaceae bacterium]|nr:MAG: hypothetical protein FD134_2435 [Gallionellaceae bacterium]
MRLRHLPPDRHALRFIRPAALRRDFQHGHPGQLGDHTPPVANVFGFVILPCALADRRMVPAQHVSEQQIEIQLLEVGAELFEVEAGHG